MKKKLVLGVFIMLFISSFNYQAIDNSYLHKYTAGIKHLEEQLIQLQSRIGKLKVDNGAARIDVIESIHNARKALKDVDFWLRYLEPIAYKRLNGPLPVEWESEVFEKYEKPYRRQGAGLTLAELYLAETMINRDTLQHLIRLSLDAVKTYSADSITGFLKTPDHFFLANRLFLLNLAAIYTTGFECPDKPSIVPELRAMLLSTGNIYKAYNESFANKPLPANYLALYDKANAFVNSQPDDYLQFDHYRFIKEFVNPLFGMNQQCIDEYGVVSKSYNDYTLNNTSRSIFDKQLYLPQNSKGVYSLVKDSKVLEEIKQTGKLLFYDPILSGNNQRSCISCHKSTEYFTDTTIATTLQFNGKDHLPRNTPSLVNVVYNHLIMLDGKHISLQAQARDVMTNPIEMGGNEKEIMEKIMSCKDYRTAFRKFLKYVPEEKEVTLEHVISAITLYYSQFSNYYSPFDESMNSVTPVSNDCKKGFNLFMGKAQCGTCHYVPAFNGVKPPYIGSEFEVIGVPADKQLSKASDDKGRYLINPAPETNRAFRTGTIRNAEFTKPYMHNGVFTTLEEIVEFYNNGGGRGNRLDVPNQTLSADSLHLSVQERGYLIAFMKSLNEKITFDSPPAKLPASADKALNSRKVGGEY